MKIMGIYDFDAETAIPTFYYEFFIAAGDILQKGKNQYRVMTILMHYC